MRRHTFGRVVAAVTIVTALFLMAAGVKAQGPATWLDSPLFIRKQADVTSEPPSVMGAGNISCIQITPYDCAVSTPFGEVTDSGSVGLNYSSNLEPITNYIENRQRFLPIPGSDTGISYTIQPATGFHLYFNHNVYSDLEPTYDYLHRLVGYKIEQPPDGKLADKSGKLLAADYDSMGFSSNSQWMVVTEPNVATLRVNLNNYEVLPFGYGFDYWIGLDPGVKTAISNDGRYAVIASKTFSGFTLYDLSTCRPVPDSFSGPVGCKSRDLESYMRKTVPGYHYVHNIRFLNDDTIAVYAVQKMPDGKLKNSRFIVSTSQINNQIDYLTLGDSYISGEGTYDYMPGTDTSSNKCHLSYLSYPYLIGQQLGYNSYHSVACSGAKTNDIDDDSAYYVGQADKQSGDMASRAELDRLGLSSEYLADFTPGYLDQLDFVKTYQPSAITVSIGGNDMGFSDILYDCIMPHWDDNTCYDTYEDRFELVNLIDNKVFNNLVSTYKDLEADGPPDMRVYAIGYPQIAKPGGDCADNVRLNTQEILFSQQLITYFDSVIQQAAAKAGVYYVDTQNALYGHRLCEASGNELAMNGVKLGNDIPIDGFGPVGKESYHPNAYGYQLLRNKILAATDNLTAPMPWAEPNAAPPDIIGQPILNVPKSGRSLNVIEPDDDIASDAIYKNSPVDFNINGADHALPPYTTLNAELHSTPVELGKFTTDASGNATGQITIPADVPPGYHVLHFYGADIAGQAIDIYKTVFVADKPTNSSTIINNGSASQPAPLTPTASSKLNSKPQTNPASQDIFAPIIHTATLGASTINKLPKTKDLAMPSSSKFPLSYMLGGGLVLGIVAVALAAKRRLV